MERFWSVLEVKYEMTKSSSDIVNANSAPVTTPGMISGRVTLQKACKGVQPRSRAASFKEESICFSFGMTFRMT